MAADDEGSSEELGSDSQELEVDYMDNQFAHQRKASETLDYSQLGAGPLMENL